SSRGIEPADSSIPVAREPDAAGLVDDEVVGIGAGFDLVAPELSGGGIEIGDVVALLTNEPHPSLRVEVGIARPRVLPRHLPLCDLQRRTGRSLGRNCTGDDD